MRIIITGGLGFIGGHFVDYCHSSGDEVMVIDSMTYAANRTLLDEFHSRNIPISISSINSYEDNVVSLARFKPDVVVNFAAETHVDNSIDDCSEFVSTNVNGTKSLLDACNEFQTKVCHISTDEVYGPTLGRSFTELDRLAPMNPYSATKAAADMLIQAYQNTYNTKAMIIRPSNNFGPRQNVEKFIPKIITSILLGRKIPLYGDGLQEREWTFVHDTARLIRNTIAVEKNWCINSVYNLSSNMHMKNRDVIQSIIDVINAKFERSLSFGDVVEFVTDRPGHDKRYAISSERLSGITDLQFTSFDRGLALTVESML